MLIATSWLGAGPAQAAVPALSAGEAKQIARAAYFRGFPMVDS